MERTDQPNDLATFNLLHGQRSELRANCKVVADLQEPNAKQAASNWRVGAAPKDDAREVAFTRRQNHLLMSVGSFLSPPGFEIVECEQLLCRNLHDTIRLNGDDRSDKRLSQRVERHAQVLPRIGLSFAATGAIGADGRSC